MAPGCEGSWKVGALHVIQLLDCRPWSLTVTARNQTGRGSFELSQDGAEGCAVPFGANSGEMSRIKAISAAPRA